MSEDWFADVRRYVADADENVVKKIVRYCGIALRNRDSSLVSFSDSKETDRVRQNYLKKKLGLTHDDATLDAGIAAVGERMKADRTKNRVTVYYLLAEHFDALGVFGGAARAAGAVAAGAAAAGAAGIAALSSAGAEGAEPARKGKAEDSEAVATASAAAQSGSAKAAPAAALSSTRYDPGMSKGQIAAWLFGGLGLAAFLAMAYDATRNPVTPMPDAAVAPAPAAPAAAPAAPAAAAAAIPQGAAVIAGERESRPMLTVYFDTGKSDVAPDFPAVAAPVKAYLDANPASTLAVSGFNDPTGSAAANAELSKNRAKKVKAAFEALGVAPERVLLEKPAETTGTGANNAESRRVEAIIKG